MLISYKVFKVQVLFLFFFVHVILHKRILVPVLHCHFSVISTPVKSCTEPLEKSEGIQSGLLKIYKETFSLDGDKF